jgi:hypothetical protein
MRITKHILFSQREDVGDVYDVMSAEIEMLEAPFKEVRRL